MSPTHENQTPIVTPDEFESLKSALVERDIQLEAMTRFEREYDLQIQEILDKKDRQIQELENNLMAVTNEFAKTEGGNKLLQELVSHREQEVGELELRMRSILEEKMTFERSLRDSVSDSMLDYEGRMDALQRDILMKDGELVQLREALNAIPKLQGELEDSERLRLRISQLEGELAQRMHSRRSDDRVLALPASSHTHAFLAPVVRAMSITAQVQAVIVPEPPHELTHLSDLRQDMEDGIAALERRLNEERVSLSGVVSDWLLNQPHLSPSFDTVQICVQQVEEFRRLAETYRSEARVFERALAAFLQEGGATAALVEQVLSVAAIERGRKLCIDEDRDRLCNEVRVLTAMVRSKPALGVCVYPAAFEVGQGPDLARELKKMKLQLAQANKKIIEMEEAESKRRLGTTDVAALRMDISRLKQEAALHKKEEPKRREIILTQTSFIAVNFVPQNAPTGSLREQLYAAQDEVFALRKKIEVELRLQRDMDLLQIGSKENENIRLRARVDDLEYHLEKLSVGVAAERVVEEELLRMRLENKELAKRMQKVDSEFTQKNLEIVRLKNKILQLDFDITLLQSKLDRATHDSPGATPLAELRSDKKVFSKPTPPNPSLEREIACLKEQREQDKAALAEAEKVLDMVQATEQKYMRVAKENAKLRKDIAALDDETFWNDLETLQTQHKECVGLLRSIRDGRVKSETLLGDIVRLVGPGSN